MDLRTTNTRLQTPVGSTVIGASPVFGIACTPVNNGGTLNDASPRNAGTSNANTSSAASINESPANSITFANEHEKIYVVTVGFGKTIRYKERDLREPPSITFATNISRLDRVWDDEQPGWDPEDCGKNLLSINGAPVALRYWRDVFSGKKNSVWASLKKLWSEWKVDSFI